MCWPVGRVLAMWFPYSVHWKARLPKGPFVAAVNHFAHLDPPFAGLALARPTRFLALDDLWGNSRLLDAAFRMFGAITLPRENRYPVAALRAALAHLDNGGAVGVFPEGRRVEAWGDTPLKQGAAWLAIRANVPLVPVAIWGTQHAMPHDRIRVRRAAVQVVVGEPIDPAEFVDSNDPALALTEAWKQAIDREFRHLQGL